MLVLGIFLTILGFFVFQWSANALGKSFIDRPLIFNNTVAILIINLIWIGLLGGGFYFLWQANPKIVLSIIGIFAILWVFNYFMGSEKIKAKKIFKIYKKLKLFRPVTKEEEIFKETARIYFQSLRWDEDRIDGVINAIFEDRIGLKKDKDIKDIVSSILIFESPHEDFGLGSYKSIGKRLEKYSKKAKVIEEAYKAIFGKKTEVIERPVLSEGTLQRMQQIGLRPEEMSNEQLAAIESLESPGKSHWIAKPFTYLSYGLFILAIISLITLDWKYFLIYLIAALIFGYIGHIIQSRISGKRFTEASIKKFARSEVSKEKRFSHCPNCGAQIKKSADFCTQCGEKI